jgi:hypothetical protein
MANLPAAPWGERQTSREGFIRGNIPAFEEDFRR